MLFIPQRKAGRGVPAHTRPPHSLPMSRPWAGSTRADYVWANSNAAFRLRASTRCSSTFMARDGYCAMSSFLSGEVVDCRGQMQKAGVDTKKDFVAVFGGLCYMDNKCSGLYSAQIRAQDLQGRAAATEILSRGQAGLNPIDIIRMSRIPPWERQELADMSSEDKKDLVDQATAAIKRVQEICDACSPYCVR